MRTIARFFSRVGRPEGNDVPLHTRFVHRPTYRISEAYQISSTKQEKVETHINSKWVQLESISEKTAILSLDCQTAPVEGGDSSCVKAAGRSITMRADESTHALTYPNREEKYTELDNLNITRQTLKKDEEPKYGKCARSQGISPPST